MQVVTVFKNVLQHDLRTILKRLWGQRGVHVGSTLVKCGVHFIVFQTRLEKYLYLPSCFQFVLHCFQAAVTSVPAHRRAGGSGGLGGLGWRGVEGGGEVGWGGEVWGFGGSGLLQRE